MSWEEWWTYDGISGQYSLIFVESVSDTNVKKHIIKCEAFIKILIDQSNYTFAGPSFWGLINPDWNLCSDGKRQSPVNVDPRNILYDPGLSDISVDDAKVGLQFDL